MRAKYYGRFEILHNEADTILVHEGMSEDQAMQADNYYSLNDFMRSSGDTFHGVMGVSNTTAIGIKINDTGDAAKLWGIS